MNSLDHPTPPPRPCSYPVARQLFHTHTHCSFRIILFWTTLFFRSFFPWICSFLRTIFLRPQSFHFQILHQKNLWIGNFDVESFIEQKLKGNLQDRKRFKFISEIFLMKFEFFYFRLKKKLRGSRNRTFFEGNFLWTSNMR